jgi:putative colanic acid biosynthesis acetyltransferase WcaF
MTAPSSSSSSPATSSPPVAADANAERMAAAPPARRSVWTPKQKLVRLAWGTLGRWLWVLVPGARSRVLRAFGAKVGRDCRFHRRVEITIPWHLDLGDGVIVGEGAILYGLGMITIGSNTVLDYGAHLCAGSHDMRDPRFPLTRPPITIGANCTVGIDAYVSPGVTIGDDVVVWARASVYKDVPGGVTVRGNPAQVVDVGDAP